MRSPSHCVIADSNADDLNLLVQALLEAGAGDTEFSALSSGVEVWDLLSERVKQDRIPDLVILSYRLPVLDGYRIAGMMRLHPSLENVPVIVLWGDSFDWVPMPSRRCRRKPRQGHALRAFAEELRTGYLLGQPQLSAL